MRTQLLPLPLGPIRQWIPVQDIKRAATWAFLIAVMTYFACLLLGVINLALAASMFVTALYLALQSQRLMIPARLIVEGMPATEVIRAVDEIINSTQPGKYIFQASETTWRYFKYSWLYAWDPIIKAQTQSTSVTFEGPHLLLKSIDQLLRKHVRS